LGGESSGNGGALAGAGNGGALGGFGGGEPDAGAGGSGGEPNAGAGGEAPLPKAIDLALGAFHTCARFDDNSMRCWGSGGYTGSGNTQTIGDDELPSVAGDVVIGGDVRSISASWYHTCALLASGKLRCFGNGGYGMLGYGNSEDIGDNEAPAAAGDVDVGGDAFQVSVGPYHTCAVLLNNRARCWGRNDHFQLGYSGSEDIGDDESPAAAGPVDVAALVVRVTAGYAHSCALLDSGDVRCWGSSIGGSLGYGNLETIGDNEAIWTAGDVPLGGKALQVAAGMLHTCALLNGGRVRCWGSGQDGKLGYGNSQNIGDDETPASAGDVDVGGKVTQIAVGAYASCALLDTGDVRCWGSGQQGELGYGNSENIGDNETPASAGNVDIGGKAIRIGVGFLHACAVLDTGAVRCWGRGTTGALGYGNLENIGDNETPASAGDVRTHLR
jgi:alpha-tubulin suppressor-like RCC1 family protein